MNSAKRTTWVTRSILAVMAAFPACGLAAQDKPDGKGLEFGGELDIVPYVESGYYGSGFMGQDGWKFRYVVARTNVPSFLVSDGYKDKRTDAYALLSDRFFGAGRRDLKGVWVGGGVEYWRNRIRTDASPVYVYYQNYVATLGGGYVWKVSRHLYVNPWAGGHFVIAHSRDVPVAGTVYKQPFFTPEGSVKIGFTF